MYGVEFLFFLFLISKCNFYTGSPAAAGSWVFVRTPTAAHALMLHWHDYVKHARACILAWVEVTLSWLLLVLCGSSDCFWQIKKADMLCQCLEHIILTEAFCIHLSIVYSIVLHAYAWGMYFYDLLNLRFRNA